MDRRTILKSSAIVLGFAVTGGSAIAVLQGCQADESDGWAPSFLSKDEVAQLAEVAETIIPRTKTPGAKDAFVHRYIDEALKNNFINEEQEKAKSELQAFLKDVESTYGTAYTELNEQQKNEIMQVYADDMKSENPGIKGQFFRRFKSLVVTGYFTSKVGATQALVYDPIPGPYQGCIPFSEVEGVYSLD